jgi:hypothetical protein
MTKFEIRSVRLSHPLQERNSNFEGSFSDFDSAMAYLRELEGGIDCLVAEVVSILTNDDTGKVVAQGQRPCSRRGNGGSQHMAHGRSSPATT